MLLGQCKVIKTVDAVTPIDSVVTTATAVGQWSTVKAAQKGVVSGQRVLRNTINANNSRSQCGIDGLVRKSNISQLVTRACSGRLGSSG